MFLRCCVIILCLYYVKTSAQLRFGFKNNDFIDEFSLWPSFHNGARTLRNRRAAQDQEVSNTVAVGQMEGMVGSQTSPIAANSSDTAAPATNVKPDDTASSGKSHVAEHSTIIENKDQDKSNASPGTESKVTVNTPTNTSSIIETPTNVAASNATVINTVQKPIIPTALNVTEIKNNLTTADNSTVKKEIDFNSPGVVKRGAIVFGGFALLAVAYFIFYRSKQKNNEANNMHSSIDANQFRYGVLQSEDRRDNLESSRIPLTMESDEDDDDDMEIFDLGEKKKSLSYVNLQLNDEDVVMGSQDGNDRDNLLLDIEDGNDTLINWSSSGSKSVL